MAKTYLNDVVQIMKSKKGAIYIKVTEDGDAFKALLSNLKPGDAIFCNSQEDKLQKLLELGKITEERYNELLEKTDFIKYNGTYSFGE